MDGTFGQALARRYILGESLRELADATGYSTETVRRWLLDYGVKLRPVGGTNSHALADALEQARRLGETETTQDALEALQELEKNIRQFMDRQSATQSELMSQFTEAIEAHFAAMSSPRLAGKCTAARNDLMRHLRKAITRYTAKRLGLSEEETVAYFEAKLRRFARSARKRAALALRRRMKRSRPTGRRRCASAPEIATKES